MQRQCVTVIVEKRGCIKCGCKVGRKGGGKEESGLIELPCFALLCFAWIKVENTHTQKKKWKPSHKVGKQGTRTLASRQRTKKNGKGKKRKIQQQQEGAHGRRNSQLRVKCVYVECPRSWGHNDDLISKNQKKRQNTRREKKRKKEQSEGRQKGGRREAEERQKRGRREEDEGK